MNNAAYGYAREIVSKLKPTVPFGGSGDGTGVSSLWFYRRSDADAPLNQKSLADFQARWADVVTEVAQFPEQPMGSEPCAVVLLTTASESQLGRMRAEWKKLVTDAT